jgi:hypothetical protein
VFGKVKFSWTVCIFIVIFLISQSVITVSAASPASPIGGSNNVKGVSTLEAVMASQFVYAPLDHFNGKKLKDVFDLADQISNPKNSKKEKNRLIKKYKVKYKLDNRDIELLTKNIYETRKYIKKRGLNENLLGSWKIIGSKDDNRYNHIISGTGFFGSAFEKGNVIVISFRGTELNDLGDVATDKNLFGGIKTPAQYAVAKKFVEKVAANKLISKKKKIILTGHSLGGWLVQKATIDIEKKSTKLNGHPFGGSLTFNAPGFWSGSLDKKVKSKNSNDYYNKYITNYIINSDLVGGTVFSDHVGKRVVLPFNSSQVNKPLALDEHGISNFYLIDYSKSGQMIFGTKFKKAHKQDLTGIGDAFSGGRDWLDGGPGNTIDTLMGFAANDTYIFGKGYGKDHIYETDLYGEIPLRGNGDKDVIMIKDIPATETVISRNQDDLKISFIKNASDSIVIHRFFKMRMYEVEMAKFSKGSTIFLDLPFPSAPKVNSVADTSTLVQGTAIPNSTVSIKSRGLEIGGGNTDSKGSFKVKIPKQKAGTTLSVSVINKARHESKATTAIVKGTPPVPPKVSPVTDKTTYLKGTGEANANVTVSANGKVIGSGKIDSKGNFSIKIVLQKAGTKLTVTAKDAAGNVSSPTYIMVSVSPINVTGQWLYNSNQLMDLTQKGNVVEGTLHTIADGVFWDLPISGTVSGNQVELRVLYQNADALYAAGNSPDFPYNVAVQAARNGLSNKITFTVKDGVASYPATFYSWHIDWINNNLSGAYNGGSEEAIQRGSGAVPGTIQWFGNPIANVTGNWLYQGNNKISLKQDGYKVTGIFYEGQLQEPIEGRVFGNQVYLRLINDTPEQLTGNGVPLPVANLMAQRKPSSLLQFTFENGKAKFTGEFTSWYVYYTWDYQIQELYNGGSMKNRNPFKFSFTLEKIAE